LYAYSAVHGQLNIIVGVFLQCTKVAGRKLYYQPRNYFVRFLINVGQRVPGNW